MSRDIVNPAAIKLLKEAGVKSNYDPE